MCARSNRVTSDRYSIKFDACNVLNQRPFLGEERKTSARAECFLNGIHNVIMQMLKVIPADLSAIETVGGCLLKPFRRLNLKSDTLIIGVLPPLIDIGDSTTNLRSPGRSAISALSACRGFAR